MTLNKSNFVQSSIFDSFQKLHRLSVKQKLHKEMKRKPIMSPIVITIESDSDNEFTKTYEDATLKVRRKLKFDTEYEEVTKKVEQTLSSVSDNCRSSNSFSKNSLPPKKRRLNFEAEAEEAVEVSSYTNSISISEPSSGKSPKMIALNKPSVSVSTKTEVDTSNLNDSDEFDSDKTFTYDYSMMFDEANSNLHNHSYLIISENNPNVIFERINGAMKDCDSIFDSLQESQDDFNTVGHSSTPVTKNDSSESCSSIIESTSLKSTPQKNHQQNSPLVPSSKRSSLETHKKTGSPHTPAKNKLNSTYLSPSKSDSSKTENVPPITRYLRIITNLFTTVQKTKYMKDLLTSEQQYLKIFSSSGPNANVQFVCLKLFTWKRKWYNIFKFCEKINVKMDEDEITELYHYLKETNIVDTDYLNEDLECLLKRLNKTEVRDLYLKYKLKKGITSKEDMIATILRHCNTQCTLTFTKSMKDIVLKEIKKKLGYCVKINIAYQEAFHNAYILATLTNPFLWEINDFFNVMMAQKWRFPDYAVQEYPIFFCRNDFLRYVKARKLAKGMDDAFLEKKHSDAMEIGEQIFGQLKKLENNDKNEQIHQDVPHLKYFTAKVVYISALSRAVKPLSTKYPINVKDWLEYLIQKYESHRIGEWYYHLSWLYMRYLNPIDFERAAELIIDVLKNKREIISEVQLLDLGDKVKQLFGSKKYKVSQQLREILMDLTPSPLQLDDFPQVTVDAKTIRSSELGKKRNYVTQDSEGNSTYMSVENIALDYYIEECGYTGGRHCEGQLVAVTFTLFFWDIIYYPDEPVPATFLSKIQRQPLDMYSTNFYLKRKTLIDKRLKDIESDWNENELFEFIKTNYTLHSHKAGFCQVNNHIDESEPQLLDILVNCIGRKVLSKIYERFVKNIKAYHSGLPDLLVWNAAEKTCKFVEVKGEGDTLSTKQKLWLKYLLSIGAQAEVCHVHSIGSKRKQRGKAKTGAVLTSNENS